MNVKHVAAGENALHKGLAELVDDGSLGDGAYGNSRKLGQLVFGDKAHRKQQGVALIEFFGSGDGASCFVNLGDGDPLHPVFAVNFGDGVGKQQRNVVGDKAFVHIFLGAV